MPRTTLTNRVKKSRSPFLPTEYVRNVLDGYSGEIFDYLHSHITRLEPTTYLEAYLSV